MAHHESVDGYIATFPGDVQEVLQEVRRTIREVVPDGEETISYGIPTITVGGRYLVYFAGWKHHISLYPLPHGDEQLQRDLAPYMAGKGTAKFTLGEPVPYDLIERVTRRLADERNSGPA
ncbi:iron chaperone [Georgenia subflava]|uniref:YdhG-like domain-containing protein n=1 Tax=Georgenia subflava TaxID=1622177 RepID=A0A6N7EJE2_9MICO|nr:DUF1801 domain-containing protein [Georgenia subflava]MPV37168.1 hypothetical protein [Georgenia subflava]